MSLSSMVCFVLQTADSSFPLVVGLFCGVEGADKSCTTHIFCAPSLDRSNGVGQSDCGHCSSVKICQSYSVSDESKEMDSLRTLYPSLKHIRPEMGTSLFKRV